MDREMFSSKIRNEVKIRLLSKWSCECKYRTHNLEALEKYQSIPLWDFAWWLQKVTFPKEGQI